MSRSGTPLCQTLTAACGRSPLSLPGGAVLLRGGPDGDGTVFPPAGAFRAWSASPPRPWGAVKSWKLQAGSNSGALCETPSVI